MWDSVIQFDRDLFIFLNGLGSQPFDPFWKIITKQVYWSPLFLVVFYLLQKKMGWKNLGIILLFLTVLVACTDQITNLFKTTFERLRPCNVPELKEIMRTVVSRKSFSFFSGHAANSMASTMLIYLIMKPYYKHTYLLFCFPLVFAYSRIYLGLHFPGDIVAGYFFGSIFGWVCFMGYKKYIQSQHSTNS